MAGLYTTQPVSILPPTQQSAGSVKQNTAQVVSAARGAAYESAVRLLGQSDGSLQSQIDTITQALRNPLPFPQAIGITDQNGNLIAWIGDPSLGGPQNVNGVPEFAWFQSLSFGNPPTNPVGFIEADGTIQIESTDTHSLITMAVRTGNPFIQFSNNVTVLSAVLQTDLIEFQTSVAGAFGKLTASFLEITDGASSFLNLDLTNGLQVTTPTGDNFGVSHTDIFIKSPSNSKFVDIQYGAVFIGTEPGDVVTCSMTNGSGFNTTVGYQANGTPGVNATIHYLDWSSVHHTLVFTMGLLTSST